MDVAAVCKIMLSRTDVHVRIEQMDGEKLLTMRHWGGFYSAEIKRSRTMKII
jgi:hypothetical protein